VFRSIRWRIAIPFVILIVVTASALGWFLNQDVRQVYLRELESRLGAQASLTAEALNPYIAQGAQPDQMDALAGRWAGLLETEVTIIAADGTVIGESGGGRSQMGNQLNQPEVSQALTTGYGSATRADGVSAAVRLYVAVPLVVSGKTLGVVRLGYPLQHIQTNLIQLERVLAAIALAAVLASWQRASWQL